MTGKKSAVSLVFVLAFWFFSSLTASSQGWTAITELSGGGAAKIEAYEPLRQIGEDVYDFTPVIRHQLAQGKPTLDATYPKSKYLVLGNIQTFGEIQTRMPKGAFLGVVTGLHSQGGQVVSSFVSSFVKNAPSLNGTRAIVALFALPLDDGKNEGTFYSQFDYGTPYRGSLSNLTVLQVTENGIVKTNYHTEKEIEDQRKQGIEDKRAALDQNVVASLKKNAVQGDQFAQYDLAQRYFDGKGVEQDRALGLHWLEAAATNGNRSAKASLDRLNQTPPTLTNAPSARTAPPPP
jgi:hypothetical protein